MAERGTAKEFRAPQLVDQRSNLFYRLVGIARSWPHRNTNSEDMKACRQQMTIESRLTSDLLDEDVPVIIDGILEYCDETD